MFAGGVGFLSVVRYFPFRFVTGGCLKPDGFLQREANMFLRFVFNFLRNEIFSGTRQKLGNEILNGDAEKSLFTPI